MEEFEGKKIDQLRIVCLIWKSQKQKIKELVKEGKIEKFNMSLFLRTKLDEYIREKTEVKA